MSVVLGSSTDMSTHIHVYPRTRDASEVQVTYKTFLRNLRSGLWTYSGTPDPKKTTYTVQVTTAKKTLGEGRTMLVHIMLSAEEAAEARAKEEAEKLAYIRSIKERQKQPKDMAIKGTKEDERGITYGGKWYTRITSVQSMGAGKYKIKATHGEYTLEGGRRMGGARNDWFLEGSRINGHINVTGLVDALNLLQNM